MKKITLLAFILLPLLIISQVTISPSIIEVNQSITITIDENSSATDCNGFNNPNKVYIHSGIGDDGNPWGFNVVGNWGQDDELGEMTNNGDGTWSITFIPETYYNINSTQAANATKMGMVFRNEDGSQEFKDNGCSDFFFNVGSFQVNLISPSANETVIINTGGNLNITASNTSGNADYELFANGTSVNSQNNISSYNFNHTSITSNINYELLVSQGGATVSKFFSLVINPGEIIQALPSGNEDGINYNAADATKAILVLSAPLKDFIYVAGSFNNWQPSSNYAMKKDPTSGKFWLELTGLTSNQIETYQYWVFDTSPIANSPELVKTADPFSTLVLSPFDDSSIPANSYPNLPTYPSGQEREVTVLQTNQTDYNWQVSNFNKPKKEDLVIYEVLIRDFDTNRNYQDLIDRISYFKELNINAIELMPIMEYEGNESWGYNTAFHMALDKYYGTANKLKELVDVCHQNGIAVILDIALNHAFGRNPMNRMWMNDPDGDGWGGPSSESPYFNVTPTHSYNVGSDFNHQQPLTKNYTKRVVKHWIEEFHIDGFRWDLTKGFTQNCAGSESCTNSYQQDRIDVLKEYVDYSWLLDPTHYAIFEHLGSDTEEQQWANYRINDAVSKGVMMWGKMTDQYNQLTMGYSSNTNINRMGHTSHGFNTKRLVGYPESHDEERLMYKNITFGNSSNTNHDVKDLDIALSRMSALGAVSLTIPGPKMIWHFAELGMENSINTCTNGVVDGNCKLDTKPQPQWINNWQGDTDRNQIYNDWSRLNDLKINEPVFEGSYTISSGNLTPKIYIWDDTLPSSELKNVVILANFNTTAQNVVPNFPYIGSWYDLMDNSLFTVANTTSTINLQPGEFRIYGNKETTIGTNDFSFSELIQLYPNPTEHSFKINKAIDALYIYNLNGKLIKRFIDNYEKDTDFVINDLSKGLYLVKIITNNNIAIKRITIK